VGDPRRLSDGPVSATRQVASVPGTPAPPSQITVDTHLREYEERCAFVISPRYFKAEVPKQFRRRFDAYRWNAAGARMPPSSFRGIHVPIRICRSTRPRFADHCGEPGSLILFSAQHLHATVPNMQDALASDRLPTVNATDIHAQRGAKLVDAACTGTTLRDFLRASDWSAFRKM